MKVFAMPSFFGAFMVASLAIAGMFVFDLFLAGVDRTESRKQAERLFGQGEVLMGRGDYAGAIDRIGEALADDRGNPGYEQKLAEAELSAGRTSEAEETLSEVLQAHPADGPASLTMARALRSQGKYPEAISYYHRAIFGNWRDDAAGNRLRVRYELIDLLAEKGQKDELLAELLPVEDQAPDDVKTGIRIGRLFLQAGSPARAEEVFRNVLLNDSSDPDAYAGIGDAEFTRGDYRVAQRNYQSALRLDSGNQIVRQRLDLCAKLEKLDPTIRGLGADERFRRSVVLLQGALDEMNGCSALSATPDSAELATNGEKVLKARVPAAHQNDVAESNLDLAERIWQVRLKECKSPPSPDDPFALMLARLAQ